MSPTLLAQTANFGIHLHDSFDRTMLPRLRAFIPRVSGDIDGRRVVCVHRLDFAAEPAL